MGALTDSNAGWRVFAKLFDRSVTIREIIFLSTAVACVIFQVPSAIALLLGIGIAQMAGHPYLHLNHKVTRLLLQISVVGLGFGMDAHNAFRVGKDGIFYIIAFVVTTLTLGLYAGRLLKVDRKTSFLICAGTAICGGSAIAALSPAIEAKEGQVSTSLGTIFILNAAALILFPWIGHLLTLSQTQFGTWCAIAIHDTSSVVGAAGKYGNEALEVATTLKLARALLILPLSLSSAFIFKGKSGKIKIPYFIGLFILGMIINTWVPAIHPFKQFIAHFNKMGFTLTLFLIGTAMTRNSLANVGIRPLIQGILLWVAISCLSLQVVTLIHH